VPGEDRILTIPNIVTVVRLACVPLFLWLLFGRENRAAAAYLLGALGATDWVDGYVSSRIKMMMMMSVPIPMYMDSTPGLSVECC
jgi:phosphatidylglycerophosphate synthase